MKLQTAKLGEMKAFYRDTLGFRFLHEDDCSFRVSVGASELIFTAHEVQGSPAYHFAINIPANQFVEAKSWAKERVVLQTEEGEDEADFDHLPAMALYFLDPSGNIVELIARKTSGDGRPGAFSVDSLLNISEIGVVVDDPVKAGGQLAEIGVMERDRDKLSPGSLNFMGLREKGIFIILAPRGRRWIFSDTLSEIYPLDITLSDGSLIILDVDGDFKVWSHKYNERLS